jgi:hypothetical protein
MNNTFIEIDYGIYVKTDCLDPCSFSINSKDKLVCLHLNNGDCWTWDSFETSEEAAEFYHELIARLETAELEQLMDLE